MGKPRDFSRSSIRADELSLLSAALRKRVGPGRPLSIADLAAEIRVGHRTAEGWLYGETAPRFGELRRLIALLDPGFGTDILAGSGRLVVDAQDHRAAALLRAAPGLVTALRSILLSVDQPS